MTDQCEFRTLRMRIVGFLIRPSSMSLPQLVGLDCVVCQKTVNSERAAKFCDECGNPVHRDCVASEGQTFPEGRCSRCGGDPASQVAAEVWSERRQQGRDRKQPGLSRAGHDSPASSASLIKARYPVSKVCPRCGHADYKKRKPETWVAFSWDRVCKACDTRYTPQTPVWAAIVFLMAGFLLVLAFGIGGVLAILLRGDPLSGLIGCALGFMGVLAVAYGVHALIQVGRQLPTRASGVAPFSNEES